VGSETREIESNGNLEKKKIKRGGRRASCQDERARYLPVRACMAWHGMAWYGLAWHIMNYILHVASRLQGCSCQAVRKEGLKSGLMERGFRSVVLLLFEDRIGLWYSPADQGDDPEGFVRWMLSC